MFDGRDLLPTLADRADNPAPAPKRLTRKPDVIYTFGKGGATCCLAVQSGFSYGVNSNYCHQVCRRSDEPRHRIVFVDNPYKRYDHEKHLEVVADVKPRYATVRDMMTKEQCENAGIKYYPPGQILDWAAELEEHAQRIILIPKAVKYLEMVPSRYVIGLPVPSRYGADVLPLEAYEGHRVHLLGGSWARQLSHLYALGNNVVSLDMNYIHQIARYGQYVDPAGQTHSLKELLPFSTTNALYIAFSISCGSIQAAFDELVEPS